MSHYVTNMGQLYSMTNRRYREFLRLVSIGVEVGQALDSAQARFHGININVTDWSAADARTARSTLTAKD